MKSQDQRPIALIGMMGSGKSSVASILAARLEVEWVDLDARIESEAGCSVTELFERSGERAFRRREGEVLEWALSGGARVLACGGGVVLERSNRELLRARCRTVWLKVDPAEAARRVAADGPTRPLLESGSAEEALERLLLQRSFLYDEVAEVRVSTDARSAIEVAEAVLQALQG